MMRRLGWRTILLVAATPLICHGQDAKPEVRAGRMLTVRGTVDSTLRHRVLKAMQAASKDGVETVIFDLQPGPSEFGDCFDLAKNIARLGGNVKRTVAFINPRGPNGKPGLLAGHGLLLALACDEIVMVEDAKIGALVGDKAADMSATEEKAYQEIAQLKSHGDWFAAALANPKLGVVEVDTPAGKRVLTTDKIEEFGKKARIIKQETINEPGQGLLLDGVAAKRLGLARRLVNSRREVAAAYDLPEQIAADDSLLDESLKPVLLRLEGAVDAHMYQYVLRRLKQSESQGSNFLFVEIDCAAGNEESAGNIANAIKSLPGRKVAWVPKNAMGPASLIFLACDELVVASQAKVGNFRLDSRANQAAVNAALRLVQGSRFPEGLVRGLIDSSVEIVQVQNAKNPGLKTCKTRDEIEDADAKKLWINPRVIKPKGTVLTLGGEDAHSLDLAFAIANTPEQLQSLYDISGRVPVLQAGWVDAVVDGLTSVGGTVFLLVVGFTCLYIEFQIPGFGVGGLVAAVCFALFFWAQYLSGMANSLEIVLFLLGLCFLALELFVIPGFGITGITGIVLIFSSLVLAGQSFTIPQTDAEAKEMLTHIATLASSFVVFIALAATMSRYFPSMPIFNRMMLAPPDTSAALENSQVDDATANPYLELVGKVGLAMSPLRPSGRMQLADRYYDVVAQGEFVEAGTSIEVLTAHPNRIVVRQAEERA